MEILIIRHGDPDYAIDSLTPQGWIEAKALSNKLVKMKLDEIYCSPLGRAKDTASFTLEKLEREAVILDWLREFEGRIPAEGKDRICWDLKPSHWTKEEKYYSKDDWHKPELYQGTNVEERYRYVTKQFDEFLAQHGYVHEENHFRVVKESHDRIVFFCHFALCGVLLGHLLGISPVLFWHEFVARPTSITTVATEEREQGIANFRVLSYGDIGHLYAEDVEPSFAARYCECFSDETRH